MAIDNNFDFWRLASHPLIQEYAHLPDDEFDVLYSSHPAIAHFLDATRELIAAVEMWKATDTEGV
jgi:hypothetical protein